MRTTKSARKKVSTKSTKIAPRKDLATQTVEAVAQAIASSAKLKLGKNADDKITVNVHIGDVIMMGFDEAIDAEEWGMRENNTEIIGGAAAKGGKSNKSNNEAEKDKNRKVSRKINFRKGNLELNATEDSAPASKKRAPKKSSVSRKTNTKRGGSTKR